MSVTFSPLIWIRAPVTGEMAADYDPGYLFAGSGYVGNPILGSLAADYDPGYVFAGEGVVPGGNDTDTVFLCHFDGADASTTFADISDSAHAVAAVGNAQVDTAQSVFGGASLLLDGSGDRLTVTGSADLAFGTGDFTIDFRFRPAALPALAALYDARPSGVNGAYPSIFTENDGLLYYANTASRITVATVLSTGTWYHLALVRSSGSTKLYLDGTNVGSAYTDATDYLNGTDRPFIGESGFAPGTLYSSGHIDELRVSRVARWTSNFTPPAYRYS